ncbi:MAG: helix-turn-helix domain-containing protein [Clostridia bacterium]|nr:helix-turn-helix domain-containing protein [Clostridia bacterium]
MLKNNLKTIRMGEFFLTKRDFSKKLDIAEQQYLRYETGQSNPSLEIAIKISIKLNKHVDDIWYIDKI